VTERETRLRKNKRGCRAETSSTFKLSHTPPARRCRLCHALLSLTVRGPTVVCRTTSG